MLKILLHHESVKFLAKDTFYLVANLVVGTLGALIITLVLANLISPEDFGIFKYVLSVGSVLAIFSLGGMTTAVARSIAKGCEGGLEKSFIVQLKWGFFITFLATVMASLYFFQGNTMLALLIIWTGITVPVISAANTFKAYFWGKRIFVLAAVFGIAITIFVTSISVLVAQVTRSVFLIVILYYFSQVVINLLSYWLIIHYFHLNKKMEKTTISYGKHLSAINIIGALAQYLDVFLVFHFLGSAELAIYIMAISIPEQIKNILRSVQTALFPRFAKAPLRKIRDVVNGVLILVMVIIAVTAIGYVLMTPLFFKIFLPKYLAALSLIPLTTWLIIGIFPSLLESVLSARKEVKSVYLGGVFVPIFQLLVTMAGGIFFGTRGLILAKVTTYIFGTIFYYYLFRKATATENNLS